MILFGFAFQGLLSFSRGGMLVPFVGIILYILIGKRSILKNRKAMLFGILGILLFFVVFKVTNDLTKGNLALRYQGETEGTLLGSKEKTANSVLTGRLGIFEKDIDLFCKYPFSGVGLGSSKYLRDDDQKVAAHVEFSRLLADHGFFGIIYNILLFGMLILVYKNNKGENILFILVFIALATTFHAAMRTFVTPLFLIIGSFTYIPNKNLNN
jgi:O-antigen ligase